MLPGNYSNKPPRFCQAPTIPVSYCSLRTQETSGRLKSAAPSTDDPTHNHNEQAEEHPLPKPGLETVGPW